jgi:cytochrome c peroxidase
VENPPHPQRALLGKALFWEEQLSSDDSVACGTCHRPAAGGADARPALSGYRGHPGPDGVRGTADDPRGSPGIRACEEDGDGGVRYRSDALFGDDVQVTRRRAMSALDAMFFPELFWDGRARGTFVDPLDPTHTVIRDGGALESQALGPILNSAEMACNQRTFPQVVEKLSRVAPLALARDLPVDLRAFVGESTRYAPLFQAAFGSPEISPARIALALAQYERTLQSNRTPWDAWQAGDEAALSPAARRGLDVFMRRGNCGCCHAAPLFGSALYVNDGFSASSWDLGRAEVTQDVAQQGAFRVPSLRNVGLRESAGLLHDGVGAGSDLETLVERYTHAPLVGGRAGICLRLPLTLTEAERMDLVAFLRSGLTDPRVANETAPFDRPRLGRE